MSYDLLRKKWRDADCKQSHLRDEWASEILLGLRTVLFKFTIWDNNASYGASLQNLRYTDARDRGPVPRAPSMWQKVCYGVFAVGGRYAWTKWEYWLAQQEGGYEEVHSIKTAMIWGEANAK